LCGGRCFAVIPTTSARKGRADSDQLRVVNDVVRTQGGNASRAYGRQDYPTKEEERLN
jgi:hypothetical protein